METSKRFKQFSDIFTTIAKALISPSFQITEGGANIRLVEKFFTTLDKRYGDVSPERLVDICVSILYAVRDRPFRLNNVLTEKMLLKIEEHRRGIRFYQDEWLSDANLTRAKLVELIQAKDVHPQTQYIYMEAEEPTKSRYLNLFVGFVICQTATLGWAPQSPSCNRCHYSLRCKKETERKYPELYRIRVEDDTNNPK